MEKKIRGGALIARALKEKGIDKVFTLSGGFCNPAIEGFMECQIEVANCPHEQIAGHMADGYTRITRKPSVCLVGPEGFANAVPSMMEAWGERTPIIYITGSSSLKRQGSGGYKEIDDVSLDFIFLDAYLDYESTMRDLETWYPKVKTNGLFTGHDWHSPTVQKAVTEFRNKRKGDGVVSRLKAIAISFVDGMWFASYTVLPVIGVMWAMGIVSFNI